MTALKKLRTKVLPIGHGQDTCVRIKIGVHNRQHEIVLVSKIVSANVLGL